MTRSGNHRDAAVNAAALVAYATEVSRWSDFFRAVGIPSFGLGGAPGSLEDARQGRAAHGADERRPTRWLPEGVRFLREVVLRLAREDVQ